MQVLGEADLLSVINTYVHWMIFICYYLEEQ